MERYGAWRLDPIVIGAFDPEKLSSVPIFEHLLEVLCFLFAICWVSNWWRWHRAQKPNKKILWEMDFCVQLSEFTSLFRLSGYRIAETRQQIVIKSIHVLRGSGIIGNGYLKGSKGQWIQKNYHQDYNVSLPKVVFLKIQLQLSTELEWVENGCQEILKEIMVASLVWKQKRCEPVVITTIKYEHHSFLVNTIRMSVSYYLFEIIY